MSLNSDTLDREPILPLDDEKDDSAQETFKSELPEFSDVHSAAMRAAAEMLGISDVASLSDEGDTSVSGLRPGLSLSGGAAKDISKLQTLDYICMNTSRSAGSLVCIIKDGNAAAIKDAGSVPPFESRVPQPDEYAGSVTALDDMLYMPASLAEKIIALDAGSFRRTLSESGLSETEADAAKERLEALRGKINESIAFSQNDPLPTIPVKGIIRIIDDDDDYWEELKKKRLNLVLDRYRYEMIRNAPQSSDEYLRMIKRDFKTGMKMLEKMSCTVVSVSLFSDIHKLLTGFSDFIKDIAAEGQSLYNKEYKESLDKELNELDAELADDTSESGEYQDMQKGFRELLDAVKGIQDTEATDTECDKLRDMFSLVAEKAKLYQEHRAEAAPESGDAKHKKHLEAAGAIRKFSLCQYDFLKNAAKVKKEENPEISNKYRRELEADIKKLSENDDMRNIQQIRYARMAVDAHKYLSELASKGKELNRADRDRACEAMACIMSYHMISLQPEDKRNYGQSDDIRKAQISEMLRNPIFRKSADRVNLHALKAFLAENGIQKACGRGLHEIGKAAKPAREAKTAAKHPVREADKQEISAPVLKKDPPSSKS